jgi:hypothetical protein
LSSDAFEPAEIAELADLCARCPAERWARRRGPAGEASLALPEPA